MAERDYERLRKERDEVRPLLLPGQYRHYRNGNIYEFEKVFFSKEDESMQVMIHDIRVPDISWGVSLTEWTEQVEHEGQPVRRYTYLDEVGALALSRCLE